MNVINNTINRIKYIINECPDMIKSIPDAEFSKKPAPEKWSKKELLGHICDSAVNNLGRFVRAQFEPQPFKLIKYDQNNWVKMNNYQEDSRGNIISFWIILNNRTIDVLSKIPEEKLGNQCDLGEEGTKTLLWLIEDY